MGPAYMCACPTDVILPVMVIRNNDELEEYYARRREEARSALENIIAVWPAM